MKIWHDSLLSNLPIYKTFINMLMKHKTLFWIDFYHLTILLRNLLTAKEGRDNFGKNNMVGPFHN